MQLVITAAYAVAFQITLTDPCGSLVSVMRKVMTEMSLLTGNTHRSNDPVGASHVPGKQQ